MSTEINSLLIKTYVNCVKFFNDIYLLASAGNTLQVYNVKTSELVKCQTIFKSQRIHEIVVNNSQVLLFGGFHVALIEITNCSNHLSINVICEWTTEQWVQDASFLPNNKYAVLGSSNVLYFYKQDNNHVLLEEKFQCKERSVLYSGKILGTSWCNAVVLCGTVFSQITIWSPTLNDCNIIHRLIGHQGVIFSVTYHEGNHTICSTSDDRSLRIWKVEMEKSDNIVENWKYAKLTLLSSIFGHTARVWRNFQLNNGKIISIGEDGQLKVWSGDTCVHSWNSHQNGNIWSMDFNETSQLIVTGGGDAGIHLWPLSSEDKLHEPLQVEIELAKEDFPRQVIIARNTKLLIYTNDGIILSYRPNFIRQVLVDARFRSFCILSMSKSKEYYSTASITGDILIFHEATDQFLCEHNVGREKIFSLHWLAQHHFVVCTTQGLLSLFQFIPESKSVFSVYSVVLPPCKERWLTAAILTDNLLICGDRDGSIHVYSCETQCLIKTYHKIHSRLGVSCIEYNIHSKTVTSIGRDGFLRHWEIKKFRTTYGNVEGNVEIWDKPINKSDVDGRFSENDNSLDRNSRVENGNNEYDVTSTNVLEKSLKNSKISKFILNNIHNDISITPNLYQISADKLPLEWPAHIYNSSDGDIFILGFHEVHFVIWSTREQKIILKLKCGGGHRSWDYFLQGSHLYFSFIKQKRVFHVNVDLFEVTRPALVQSFHRDEINALVCVKMKEKQLIISGGEDNTLRISSLCDGPYNSSIGIVDTTRTISTVLETTSQNTINVSKAFEKPTLQPASETSGIYNPLFCDRSSLYNHLILRSHISSIRSLNFVHIDEDVYLVSGGGRAQLKIWKLSSIQNQLPRPITNNSHESTHGPQRTTPTIQYQCKELFSHMLNGQDRKVKSWKLMKPRINPETRYMDIALHTDAVNLYIATACSDGYVRVFRYHLETNRFEIVQELAHHGQCVLKVHIVQFVSRLILCSLSTYGDLAIWDFRQLRYRTNKGTDSSAVHQVLNNPISHKLKSSPSISRISSAESSQDCTAEPASVTCTRNPSVETNINNPCPLAEFKLHEGGINSFDSRSVGDNLLLISGGDDCSLVLTELSSELSRTRHSRTVQAHDSQITGVKFLNDEQVVSSSVDQKIVVWACGDPSRELIRLTQLDSCIPDVHGLDVMSEDRVCLFGCGIHIAQIANYHKNRDEKR